MPFMPLSIGGYELIAIAVVVAVAALLWRTTYFNARLAVATAGCAALAAGLTPADLLSMILLSLALLLSLVLGFWAGRDMPSPAR